MRGRVRGPALAWLMTLACCGPPAQPPEPESIDTSMDVPHPDLSGMEPRVAELLERARNELLATPDQAAPWGALAAAYHAHALHDVAELCYRQAGRIDGSDFRWAYLLAVVRQVNGARPEELKSLFDAAARLRPDYGPLFVRSGLALLKHGELDAAREALTRGIELDPESALAHRGLGQVLLALGDAEGAMVHLERARQLAPDDAGVYASLAQAEMRLGRHQRARKAAEHSKVLKPRLFVRDSVLHREVYALRVSATYGFSRGVSLLRKGRVAEAIDELTGVAEARPDDFDVQLALWMAHARARRPDGAFSHLSRAVSLKPDHSPSRIALARMLEDREDPDAAAMHYERAAQSAAGNAALQLAIGKALVRLGRHESALQSLQAAASLDPASADAHRQLGELLEAMGRTDEAESHLGLAARIDRE